MKLIVGLGNPGKQYEKTRHNLGFMVLEKMVGSGVWEEEAKFQSLVLKLSRDVWLVKPQTYMNNSGMAVRLLVGYFKVDPQDLTVIHDDLDLPLGKIKIRLGGAAAGHHGVESIISALGTDQFIRVRLGIGNLRTQSSEHKGAHVDAEKYVLEQFLPQEKSHVKHMIKQAVKAVEILLEKGLTVAQNQYN